MRFLPLAVIRSSPKSEIWTATQKTCPSFLLGQVWKIIPAVPPGLARFRALLTAYIHTRTFDHGGSSPSHILGEIPFCSPSEVHSFPASLPHFHPRRLSVRKDYGKYSLFFNGLSKHSIRGKKYARGRVVLLVFCCMMWQRDSPSVTLRNVTLGLSLCHINLHVILTGILYGEYFFIKWSICKPTSLPSWIFTMHEMCHPSSMQMYSINLLSLDTSPLQLNHHSP